MKNASTTLLAKGAPIPHDDIGHIPLLMRSGKIICVGLNYAEHAAETHFEAPEYPTIFARFTTSLLGHQSTLQVPLESDQLDYEGELAVVIGRAGRRISRQSALSHVCGYSVFNDASVRDYQMRTPQWTLGKNFDHTGAFGPELVTIDELPQGASGLVLETTLNDKIVQKANTNQLIFDVSTLIALLSEAMTLDPGDVIVTGTPGGIGMTRTPPLWMKPGDICRVRIDGLGTLINPIGSEA